MSGRSMGGLFVSIDLARQGQIPGRYIKDIRDAKKWHANNVVVPRCAGAIWLS